MKSKPKEFKKELNLILTSANTKENVTGGIERYQNKLKKVLSKSTNTNIIEVTSKGSKLGISRFGLKFFFQCLKQLQNNKHTKLIICDPQISMMSIAGLLISRAKKKYVISHGWMFHTKKYFYIKKIYFLFCRKFILPKFTNVVCVSVQDFNICKNLSNKILFENCLGIQANEKDCAVKRENIILIFGRYSENKNTIRSIKIMKILKKIEEFNLLNFKVIVAGKNVQKLKLDSDFFQIIESPSDKILNEIFRKSSFFVSLSLYEGFGIAPLEAMSFGIVPILSDIENHSKHIYRSKVGQIIDLELDDSVIANVIFKFIKNFNKKNYQDKFLIRRSLYNYSLNFSTEKWNKKALKIFSA